MLNFITLLWHKVHYFLVIVDNCHTYFEYADFSILINLCSTNPWYWQMCFEYILAGRFRLLTVMSQSRPNYWLIWRMIYFRHFLQPHVVFHIVPSHRAFSKFSSSRPGRPDTYYVSVFFSHSPIFVVHERHNTWGLRLIYDLMASL